MPDNLKLILLKKYSDERGYFCETFKESNDAEDSLHTRFIQDNLVYSSKKYTFRGLHQQRTPYGQDKLIHVIKGSILDIAVDIRPNSKTFSEYFSVEISNSNNKQLFIPKGFLHGYLTLKDETIVAYKVSSPYSKDNEIGVSILDKNLKIVLPCNQDELILSEKDKELSSFKKLKRELPI